MSTGEVSRRPGRYRSECCRGMHAAPAGAAMPACPRCGEPAEWTWTGPLEASRNATAP